MLSLTVFAVAASAAAQPAPIAVTAPASSGFARRSDDGASSSLPELDRSDIVWRLTSAGVDGGQIWL